jgi:phage terminase large subunit GpA-like protein
MLAITDTETHTVTVMAGTQVLKTELLINTACYYIHQDPSSILFVQPSQDAAEAFAKERFSPTVAASPALRALIKPPRAGANENTVTHKDAPGATLDFVGAHSPKDLASRPRRIILSDEIDKYPASAGAEGDPLALAEERASTYLDVNRGKLVRACSPTVKGFSRIGRQYDLSDRRKCFVGCPHCGHEQVLTWSHVKWEKVLADGTVTIDLQDGQAIREHRPQTAGITCEECGTIWTERERVDALRALEHAPDHGWRQTRPFVCCEEVQSPSIWDDAGRALCVHCEQRAPYAGHAGFWASKLYSTRHRLRTVVTEFLAAKGDPELMRKFVNTALAEPWEPAAAGTGVDASGFIDRAELYGPDDLPTPIHVITSFCDVQGDRLEVQLVGWGADEESWPFLYEVIREDPAQPYAWKELDALLAREFKTVDGRTLRVAACGVDTGGHHGAQVHAFCRRRAKRRVFACKGVAGNRPIWPTVATRSAANDKLWLVGVDTAKDSIYGRLGIVDPGPGYIHFPADDAFGEEYFRQLTSERREVRKRAGQPYTIWVLPEGRRNEALDTFVGALAVRRSLPRRIERGLEYTTSRPEAITTDETATAAVLGRRPRQRTIMHSRYMGRQC